MFNNEQKQETRNIYKFVYVLFHICALNHGRILPRVDNLKVVTKSKWKCVRIYTENRKCRKLYLVCASELHAKKRWIVMIFFVFFDARCKKSKSFF